MRLNDRIGDWIVLKRLGTSGHSAVYGCRHARSKRDVAAVKVIPAGDDVDVGRFDRTAAALASVRHAGVVRVWGWGRDAARGLLWLAMDRVRGPDLVVALDDRPLPPTQASTVFTRIADALAAAHAAGVPHGDLRPRNVIIRADGPGPCLVGFTLCAAPIAPENEAYVAPEARRGDSVDPFLADQYALGVTMYEALTGRRAPTSESPLDPGEAAGEPLRTIVRRCTDPDPGSRFPSVGDVRDRLANEPIVVPAVPPLVWATMVPTLLVVLACTGVVGWGAWRLGNPDTDARPAASRPSIPAPHRPPPPAAVAPTPQASVFVPDPAPPASTIDVTGHLALVIDTEPPGADVSVDGDDIGPSPATTWVRPGARRIRVRHRDAGRATDELPVGEATARWCYDYALGAWRGGLCR